MIDNSNKENDFQQAGAASSPGAPNTPTKPPEAPKRHNRMASFSMESSKEERASYKYFQSRFQEIFDGILAPEVIIDNSIFDSSLLLQQDSATALDLLLEGRIKDIGCKMKRDKVRKHYN